MAGVGRGGDVAALRTVTVTVEPPEEAVPHHFIPAVVAGRGGGHQREGVRLITSLGLAVLVAVAVLAVFSPHRFVGAGSSPLLTPPGHNEPAPAPGGEGGGDFALTADEPPARFIVVSTFHPPGGTDEDLTWLMHYFSDMCIKVYVKEEVDSHDPLKPFTLTPNVVREALAILRFIIDHYDRLPGATLFIHGHRTSWHSTDIVPIIRNLNWSLPYANINFDSALHIGNDYRYGIIQTMWPTLFGDVMGPIPPFFRLHCCAQFMVSRDRIRARPRHFYERLFTWATSQHELNAPDASILLEHMWAPIFGQPHDVTFQPTPEAELCTVLVACGAEATAAAEASAKDAGQRGKSAYPCRSVWR